VKVNSMSTGRESEARNLDGHQAVAILPYLRCTYWSPVGVGHHGFRTRSSVAHSHRSRTSHGSRYADKRK
jgi:hypothetical protein